MNKRSNEKPSAAELPVRLFTSKKNTNFRQHTNGEMPQKALTINYSPTRLTTFLFKIVGFLLLAGITSVCLRDVFGFQSALGFVPLFDLGMEYNIPSIYSTLSIWLCAALLWYIYLNKKEGKDRSAGYWKGLSIIFIFLGFDELASLHEDFSRFGPILWKYAPFLKISRKWVVPFSPVLIFFAVYLFRFYAQLPNNTKRRFLIAGILYVCGALGVEIFGQWYANFHNLPVLYLDLFAVAEEGLEMTGIVLFAGALCKYINEYISEPTIFIQINFKPTLSAPDVKRKEQIKVLRTETKKD